MVWVPRALEVVRSVAFVASAFVNLKAFFKADSTDSGGSELNFLFHPHI